MVAVLGFTFKENCSDIRNTKSVEVIKNLKQYGFKVAVIDPLADRETALRDYGVQISDVDYAEFDVGILLVKHNQLLAKSTEIKNSLKYNYIFDYRSFV